MGYTGKLAQTKISHSLSPPLFPTNTHCGQHARIQTITFRGNIPRVAYADLCGFGKKDGQMHAMSDVHRTENIQMSCHLTKCFQF